MGFGAERKQDTMLTKRQNLEEVMKGGNFGQYDDRLGSKAGETISHRYFRMSRRNLRFVNRYPSEALCEPLFRTNFFLWKKWKGLK